MFIKDTLAQAYGAIRAQRLRAALIILAMSIGVASVTVLTALGESARSYIVNEFEALGTHLVIVLPGRTETTGGHPPLFGETPRDLTLDDADALFRSHHIAAIAPLTIGSAPVSTQRSGAGNQHIRFDSCVKTSAPFDDGARQFSTRNGCQ